MSVLRSLICRCWIAYMSVLTAYMSVLTWDRLYVGVLTWDRLYVSADVSSWDRLYVGADGACVSVPGRAAM
eukprot:2253531-Rhodomonas_salina.1